MKYYTISRSDDLKVIGHYPQTLAKEGYNARTLEGGYSILNSNEFADFNFNYKLMLHDKARPTNYLDAHNCHFGMVIDLKFKTILEKFKLPPHRFYPVKVYHKGDFLEYYWFHYIIDIWQYTNIEASSALIMKKFDFEIEKIIPIPNLKTIDEFKERLSFEQELMLNKLFLKTDYDVIEIGEVQYFPRLLSESLLGALMDAKMTGFEAKHIDKIICN